MRINAPYQGELLLRLNDTRRIFCQYHGLFTIGIR